MNKILSFLFAALMSISMFADTYTITFKDRENATNDGSEAKTAKADLIADGGDYISAIATAEKVYQAKTGYGIKLGSSSEKGILDMTWNASGYTVTPTKVTFTIANYDETKKVKIFVNSDSLVVSPTTTFAEYSMNMDGKTSLKRLHAEAVNKSKNRFYIKSIVVTCSGEPTPQKIVESIAVTGTAIDLLQGDAFNHNGIKVMATYADATEEDVTNKAAYSGYDMSKAGTQTITVTFGGKSSTYSVLVKERGDVKLEDVNTIANIKACHAAGILKDDDVVTVKGYIANMFLKPTNFAKYGSVCVWLTDTQGGSDKEFELFNCYGLNADTLTTFAPESTGDKNVDVTIVGTDEYTFSVGNYVEATGKFKLYSGTYELQQGCYICKIGGSTPTVTKEVITKTQVTKMMVNGQLIIVRDGVKYGAMGQIVE